MANSPDLRDAESITPRQHALLFAYLAREVIQQLGEQRGAELLKRTVWRYGQERGRRMALRALADGRELTFRTYLAYGEWRHVQETDRTPSEVETLATSPDLRRRVLTCPWNDAWREADLLPYGRHYCLHIDVALVHGFCPELTLEVGETLSDGGACCEFSFRKAHLSPQSLAEIAAQSAELAPRTVMPWGYHLGHLYQAMGREIVAQVGPMGELLVSDGFAAFAERHPHAAQVAASYLAFDFSTVPLPAS